MRLRFAPSNATVGYGQSERGSGSYRLTARVAELSAGYTERLALIDAGAPIALALTRRIRWPLALGTLDQDAIVVRYSTMPARLRPAAAAQGGSSATLAVPVPGEHEILGVLSMTTFGRSMTRPTIARHAPVLFATADEIGRAARK